MGSCVDCIGHTSLSGYAHSYVWIWMERRELFLKVCPEITVYTSMLDVRIVTTFFSCVLSCSWPIFRYLYPNVSFTPQTSQNFLLDFIS